MTSTLSADEALRHARAEIVTLKSRLASESARTCDEPSVTDFEDIVGRTPSIQQLLARIGQVAATNSAVLVTGETGTGKELVARAVHRQSRRRNRPLVIVNCAAFAPTKELVARAVHRQSRRRNRPLVIVNCAALAPTLVESELFGHERGAFTGATSRRAGRFELADRGTVFLDEVGELPEAIQVKLLRVLQTGEVERLGSSQVLRVDARLIAATNRNLEAEVAAGRFRADLYYRLNVFPLHVPPLRERREDLPLLIAYLADKKGKAVGKIVDSIPPDVMQGLLQYHWPGNVRELENVLERAIILSRDGVLTLEGFLGQALPGSGSQIGGAPDGTTGPDNRTMREVERAHILRVCEQCGWRIKGPDSASVRLGLKPSTLYFRMERLGIVRPGQRPQSGTPGLLAHLKG